MYLFHGLGLGSRSDTRYRQTDVNSGTNTLVKQLSFQENLSVSDRNHIGGNIGRYVTSLGLNDGQSGQGSTTLGIAHLGSSLQKTGVKVENVTRVGLTAWGTPQKQGHLPVSHSLLRQIVEDDESVLTVVTEEFAHGAARVGSQVLQRSSIGSSGGNDNAVLHGIGVSETLDDLSDGGSLLANGDVNAEKLLLVVTGFVESLLVDDGVNGNCGFAGLTIANDQLTLTTTNGHQRIDGFDTSLRVEKLSLKSINRFSKMPHFFAVTNLHRFLDGLSGNDTRSLDTNTLSCFFIEGSSTINGITQSVNDTAKELRTDRNIDNSSGTFDDISFLDKFVITYYQIKEIKTGFKIIRDFSYQRRQHQRQ